LLKKFLRVGVITKSELIDSVNAMIAENGLEVFDLELPTGSQGVFRVFLCLLGGVCQGITHEHCSEVARKISYDPRFEWLLNKYSMEVSSPGVNRKLKSASQFKNAIGERVKCTADIAIGDVADNERRTFTGELLRADDKEIEVKLEEPLLGKEVIVVSLRNIARARVDFLF
jgi:ribosome maturation factor RimP